MSGSPRTMQNLATRAIELLCLGRLPEALETFSKANGIYRPDGGTYLESMGTALWLMGHRGVAKELYRAAVDGVRFGTIHYADFAGGVGPRTGTPPSTPSTTCHTLLPRRKRRRPASQNGRHGHGQARSLYSCSNGSPSRTR